MWHQPIVTVNSQQPTVTSQQSTANSPQLPVNSQQTYKLTNNVVEVILQFPPDSGLWVQQQQLWLFYLDIAAVDRQ